MSQNRVRQQMTTKRANDRRRRRDKEQKTEVPTTASSRPGETLLPAKGRRKKQAPRPLTEVQRAEILDLHTKGYGTRKIEKALGIGRKRLRNLFEALGLRENRPTTADQPTPANKLDPFREAIKEKVDKHLTASRILREIRKAGYTGERTILADYVRSIRTQPPMKKTVWRRFETQPAEETQFDWSPYRVPIAGVPTLVHAFGATLGYSRKIHLRFYPDERQATLLEAHVHAFEDFGGVTRRGVYDRMATIVLGSIGPDRQPLWHPRFVEFTRYYGFEPYLCKVADPDRKGKDERVFLYQERDHIRGQEFESLDDLNATTRIWLDEVANTRVHGTTRRVPDEVWREEREFLIALPESRYPACDEELRQVGPDSVLSIKGTPYTIPARLAHQIVTVRLYSDHFEVLDKQRQVAFTRRYVLPAEKGRLVIDPAHYDDVRPRGHSPQGISARLEAELLRRFPSLAELCAGIHLRMKGLAHVHLRALVRLADRHGPAAFLEAATRAQTFHRFDAQAVRRILEKTHPVPDNEPEPRPLTHAASALLAISDVDSGSLDDYRHLDTTTGGRHGK